MAQQPTTVVKQNRDGSFTITTGASSSTPLAARVMAWLMSPLKVAVVRVAAATFRGVRSITVGRRRAHGLPLWVGTAALMYETWWAWLAAGSLVAAVPWLRRVVPARVHGRRFLSDREAVGAAVALLLVGFWWATVPLTPDTLGQYGRWPAGGVVAGLAPAWWWNRRVRRPKPIVKHWATVVATHQRFVGTGLIDADVKEDRQEGPEGTAVLVISPGMKRSEVAGQDELAESLLVQVYPRLHRGSVTISAVPSLPVNQLKVLFSRRGDGGRNRYFDDPTLDPKTGLWIPARGLRDDPVHARFWLPDGATNYACVAGPGGGKGVTTRVIGANAALSDRIVMIGVDGKQGAGISSLRAGCQVYARTPEEWRAAILAVYGILHLREARYGAEGRSSFIPNPDDPLILLVLDEWKWVKARWPDLVQRVVEITGKGRSLGIGIVVNLQKGDGPSYGDTEMRANVYMNGHAWIGPAGDVGAAQVALQGADFDLSALPAEPGWGFWLTALEGVATDTVMARTLYLPSRQEVEEKGAEHPFGTAEERMRDALFPALRDPEQDLLEACMTPAGLAVIADSAGAPAGAAADAEAQSADARILQYLTDRGDDGARRGDIAKDLSLNPTYVSDRLKAMSLMQPPLVWQAEPYSPWKRTES